MNYAAIFALISKGLTIVQALYELEQDVEPQLRTLKNIVTGAKNGTVTEDELSALEAELDQQIAEFNLEV